MHKGLSIRVIGFGASLLLTIAAFLIIAFPQSFHLKSQLAFALIFAFAVFQSVVQSICFLHVLSEKGTRWNLIVFVSTLSIVFIIIVFSIWIMNQLYHNMAM